MRRQARERHGHIIRGTGFALRDARKAATLCPDCQDKVNPRDVRSDLYGYDRMSTAHLYAVPVLAAFDAIRNCSHCRCDTDDNCKAWREARELVVDGQDRGM